MPGDMRFSEYTGADRFDWETSAGALADTSYDLPVFRSWPSQPYVLIGEIYHKDARKEWQEGEFRDAVKGAKRVGGDAIIIRLTSESGVGALTGGAGGNVAMNKPGFQLRTSALVVRWQTQEEIVARKQRDARLENQLIAESPNLTVSGETATLVIKYLLQSGEGEVSPSFFESYKQIMTTLSPNDSTLSGEWIFKSVVKEKGLVAEKEDPELGLASVRADDDIVTIVSTKGKIELNFSGQNAKGRLTGQIGIGALSCKAEGVALVDKISISFSTLTPDGTAQGVVVLQRNPKKTETKPKSKLERS